MKICIMKNESCTFVDITLDVLYMSVKRAWRIVRTGSTVLEARSMYLKSHLHLL